jgi:hypothetical protein
MASLQKEEQWPFCRSSCLLGERVLISIVISVAAQGTIIKENCIFGSEGSFHRLADTMEKTHH